MWATYEGQLKPREGIDLKAFPFVSMAGRIIRSGQVTSKDVGLAGSRADDEENTKSFKQDTIGIILFNDLLLQTKIAVSVSQDFCLAMSGTIQVYCVRDPTAYVT